MENLINVQELNDERYETIDKLINENEVKDFFKSIEIIQKRLNECNIEAKEQYEYLLTLMINNC